MIILRHPPFVEIDEHSTRKIVNVEDEQISYILVCVQNNNMVLPTTVVPEHPPCTNIINQASNFVHVDDKNPKESVNADNACEEGNDIVHCFHGHVCSLTSYQAE